MSTMLSTVNPEVAASLQERPMSADEAAARLGETGGLDEPVAAPAPVSMEGVPDVGDMVIYQPRRGSERRGRRKVAALVTHRYPDERLVDLAVFFEGADTMDQQRVREAVGDDAGWIVKSQVTINHAPREIAELREEVASLRSMLLGDYEPPMSSMIAMLDSLDSRIDDLSAKAKPKAAKPKAKRGK